MGLVLKYAQRTKKGAWRYRRRVPDDLRPILGKAEITKVLEDSEKEALKAYPSVHQAWYSCGARGRHERRTLQSHQDICTCRRFLA
ncbi:DUF6538 domain-containing protein [Celeribacter persicus]|uniref:DUF6538 domain-containing protein n=1 Tax=Celeribacter persicus TaxID=1651082 RepID=UPI003CCBCD37